MLLSFTVENYRSFCSEQTLSLIASRRLDANEHMLHCVGVPNTNERALRIAAIYGANGAGKTNLVRALQFAENMVLRGTAPGGRIVFEPHLLNQKMEGKPGCFELQILEGGSVFRYGFCCDSERIHEEWLSFYEGTREREIFTRTANEQGSVCIELGRQLPQGAILPKLDALAKVGARPNQLFLTEVANLDDADAQGPLFRKVIHWFKSTLAIIRAGASHSRLAEMIAEDPAFAEFAGTFLGEANTGIAGIESKTKVVPRNKMQYALSSLLKRATEQQSPMAQNQSTADNRKDDEALQEYVTVRRIAALHGTTQGKSVFFPIQEESDGSQRLLNLLPALYRIKSGAGVFVIDELERSMHPMLARKFIEYFLRVAGENHSQIVFTTHESTLLDQDLLRRDSIWFTEKSEEGATHLYSLSDFGVRNDLRLDKCYLQGRFGAIPFLGGIDNLIANAPSAESEK